MSRRVQVWTMTTAAGAGTYAMTLIAENGVTRNLTTYRTPSAMGICKVKAMGANGVRFTITRAGHAADTLVFPQLADTLADVNKEIDIEKLLDGAGIELTSGEDVSITSTVSGNATITLVIELDDAITRVNVRAPRVAGAAAAIAATPVETGANLRAALSSSARYTLKAIFATSTTIEHLITRFTVKGRELYEAVDTPGALLTGVGNYGKLDKPITGTGAEFGTDFALDIIASAADAANVQDIYALFETN